MAKYDLTISTGSSYTKRFLIQKSDGTTLDLNGYSARMYIVKSPGVLSDTVFTSVGGHLAMGGITGIVTLSITPAQVATIDGNFYKLEIVDGNNYETEVVTGNLFLLDETKVGVEYITPMVRLKIGDMNPLLYRYTDEWVKMALVTAVKVLQLWWKSRYTVTENGVVTRNPTILFETPVTDSVIEPKDEYIMALMASYLLLEGSLENSSYDYQIWKDAEIYYSNVQSGKIRDDNVNRLWDELMSYLVPPAKRLAWAKKSSLPGYKGNDYERSTDY